MNPAEQDEEPPVASLAGFLARARSGRLLDDDPIPVLTFFSELCSALADMRTPLVCLDHAAVGYLLARAGLPAESAPASALDHYTCVVGLTRDGVNDAATQICLAAKQRASRFVYLMTVLPTSGGFIKVRWSLPARLLELQN
ncbi:MAG TPA: hypothetical protein VKD22_04210 [Ramlibacter sp.]|nr:hypothetical protein [Ramlibacter sp.]